MIQSSKEYKNLKMGSRLALAEAIPESTPLTRALTRAQRKKLFKQSLEERQV